MGKLNKDIRGLGIVELIIAIVLVILLCVVGWYVYKNHKKTDTVSTITATTVVNNKIFNDVGAGASFSYPSSWSLIPFSGFCGNSPCTDATVGVNSVVLTPPDKQLDIVWSALGGIGGACDNSASLALAVTGEGMVPCSLETVFSVASIPKMNGLFVVEGAIENAGSPGKFIPFMAVQDSSGVLTTGRHYLWYQYFSSKLLKSTGSIVFNMDNTYNDATNVGGQAKPILSSLSEAQTFFTTTDATQAKQILLSLGT
ncbi:MAG TPA: hypothetical protein VMV24_00900 [Candidatus Dormibacteraeota bacterium]|nr:hypothetical protein [Candidatus Dormibacteraeota bacterium]